MSFRSLEEIVKKAKEEKKPFWEILLEDDMSERLVSREESMQKMGRMYEMMRRADGAYDAKAVSKSGLVGQDGERMYQYVESKKAVCGDFLGQVMAKALED